MKVQWVGAVIKADHATGSNEDIMLINSCVECAMHCASIKIVASMRFVCVVKLGMNQLNELGRYFRFTYNSFVSRVYNPSEVYIRSSDSDRALTSAQAFTSGFYPANGSFQWQTGDPWQPIPIHANSPGEPDL
ncbi:hypothetical protein TELCIR_09467, partial [Teladorsagia circumcincta]